MPLENWKLSIIADASERGVGEFHVRLYRKQGSWHDEIRFDSHELKKGRKVLMPHIHIKLETVASHPDAAVIEARAIAERIVPLLEGVLKQ